MLKILYVESRSRDLCGRWYQKMLETKTGNAAEINLFW
jgi:hypothetical protein